MTINQNMFMNGWVQQDGKPNCGSCCVGSIINYAFRKLNVANAVDMDENQYFGLTVANTHSLGSVTNRLAKWARLNHPGLFVHVEEILVRGKKEHWGGALNRVTGGDSDLPEIEVNAAFFQRNHRFLLREASAYSVAGHFIIQTDVDDYWDPNRAGGLLPMTLQDVKRYYQWPGTNSSSLSLRADACMFDVA